MTRKSALWEDPEPIGSGSLRFYLRGFQFMVGNVHDYFKPHQSANYRQFNFYAAFFALF